MEFSLNQIFSDTYPPEAAMFCNQNGYRMVEIEKQDGKRRFQIQEIPAPTAEEIAEREAQEAARIAEEQRVPDLEDAVAELGAVVDETTTENGDAIIDLAGYVASLEERIAQLEGGK